MEEVETCPLEDFILFKTQSMPIFSVIHGEPQIGKSTLFCTLMNNLSLLRYNEYWDYEKYCARSLVELMEMVKKYHHQFLGYEEPQREINTTKWYDEFSQLSALLFETQGYKKNFIGFVLPCGLTIPNRHRRLVKLGIEVLKKNEELKKVWWRNTVYEFQNWKLDETFIWYNNLLGKGWHRYTDEELARATEYTNWLIKAKEVMMNDMIHRAKRLNSLDFKKTFPEWMYDLAEKVGVYI